MRKVFIENLPRWEKGTNKGKFNWRKSIGYIVKFIYDNMQGEVKIIDYYKINKGFLFKIQYNNKIHVICRKSFIQCEFEYILGIKTHEFKYQVGDIITDVKSGKLQILEQIKIKNKNKSFSKGYRYKCLICGNEDVAFEGNIDKYEGCSVCCNSPQKVLVGYNDMWTTNPDLAKLLLNPEDGYKYTKGANKPVNWKCPSCGNIIENKIISDINQYGLSCPKCSDGVSYPNKFIFNVLQQLLGDNFENEKIFNWSDNKRYDFYFKINKEAYLIEAHGLQHYQNCTRGRSLEEEQENDRLKKELALRNGIKEDNYIIIDCRESTLEWIKNHILKSKLNNIFDLTKVDWLISLKYACSSLVKQACELWNENKYSVIQISKIIKLSDQTIRKYLKQGTKLEWCNYNPERNKEEGYEKSANFLSSFRLRKIICLNNNKVFKSIKEAQQYYNIKSHGNISLCCNNKRNYCGKDPITGEKLKWMYYEEYLKINKN